MSFYLDQIAIHQNKNTAFPSNGRAQEKAMTGLKQYSPITVNRKSGKSYKNLKGLSECKSKRVRTIFTPEQLERLETEFERQQYMVGTGRHYLAATLNLSEAQVKVWFQVEKHL